MGICHSGVTSNHSDQLFHRSSSPSTSIKILPSHNPSHGNNQLVASCSTESNTLETYIDSASAINRQRSSYTNKSLVMIGTDNDDKNENPHIEYTSGVTQLPKQSPDTPQRKNSTSYNPSTTKQFHDHTVNSLTKLSSMNRHSITQSMVQSQSDQTVQALYQSAAVPFNDTERVESLHSYSILDTPAESEYDTITRLATYISDTPMSFISLVDTSRQWFKSKQGTDICSMNRELAFCAHAILTPSKPFIINDTYTDPRFSYSPIVRAGLKIRAYAGCVILSSDKFALGTLCVVDTVPRQWNATQIHALQELAVLVGTQLDQRKQINLLQQSVTVLEMQSSKSIIA